MRLQETPIPFRIIGLCSAYDNLWDSSFSFSGESHGEPELIYVLEGAVEVTENERVYRLLPGQLILHAPMEFHRIRSIENTNPHLYVSALRIEGVIPPPLYEGIYTLTPEEREEFCALYAGILTFYHQRPKDTLLGASSVLQLSSFLLRLCQAGDRKEKEIGSQGAVQYRALITEMTNAIDKNLSAGEIAKRCHISVSYMKALFKTYAGIAPGLYYNRLRCQEIERLLREGLSVSEIADRMNFASPNYLSLFFRRESGLTPSQYRKNTQK